MGCVSVCVLRYLSYWRGRFLEQPVTDFCSVIKTNSRGPVGEFTDTSPCRTETFSW